jgi:hypothetical protein
MAKEKKSAPKEMKIVGIVEELELGKDDLGLQIVDHDRPYRVVMDRQGRRLLDYVEEEVEATGVITKTKGVSEITIARFHIVDEEEEEEEKEEETWSDGDDDDFMSDRDDD